MQIIFYIYEFLSDYDSYEEELNKESNVNDSDATEDALFSTHETSENVSSDKNNDDATLNSATATSSDIDVNTQTEKNQISKSIEMKTNELELEKSRIRELEVTQELKDARKRRSSLQESLDNTPEPKKTMKKKTADTNINSNRSHKRKSVKRKSQKKKNGGNNIMLTLKKEHMPLDAQIRLLRKNLKQMKNDVKKKKAQQV